MEEEGEPEEFFQDDETLIEADVVQNQNDNEETESYKNDNTLMSAMLEQIANPHVLGEIEANKFEDAILVVDNGNDQLQENLLPQQTNETTDDCVCQKWDSSGVCYRKNVASNHTIYP